MLQIMRKVRGIQVFCLSIVLPFHFTQKHVIGLRVIPAYFQANAV